VVRPVPRNSPAGTASLPPRGVRFPLSNYDWLGFILTKAENRDGAYAAALEAEKAIQVTWAAGSPTENRLEPAANA
jgi:hypothetical protein